MKNVHLESFWKGVFLKLLCKVCPILSCAIGCFGCCLFFSYSPSPNYPSPLLHLLIFKIQRNQCSQREKGKKTPRSSSSPQVPSFIEGCGLSLSPSSLANSLLVVEWQKAQPREVSCHVIHVARARCNLLKESNLKSNSKS